MTRLHAPHVVICPYCNEIASYSPTSIAVYGRDYGPLYVCRPREAWVGVHKKDGRPRGSPAGAALRKARQKAHAAFDPLWLLKAEKEGISKNAARAKGYAWLSARMGTRPEDTHIGMFDEEQCAQVVALCVARK